MNTTSELRNKLEPFENLLTLQKDYDILFKRKKDINHPEVLKDIDKRLRVIKKAMEPILKQCQKNRPAVKVLLNMKEFETPHKTRWWTRNWRPVIVFVLLVIDIFIYVYIITMTQK